MENRVIDVRGIFTSERVKKVRQELEGFPSGEEVKIVSDDARMLKLAPKMVNSIGGVDFVKVYKSEDGFFYTIVKKQ